MNFDPRFSIYDDADALEQAMINQALSETKPLREQSRGWRRPEVAALGEARRSCCIECGLLLAPHAGKKRCLTCETKRRIRLRQEAAGARPINHKFVGPTQPVPGRTSEPA